MPDSRKSQMPDHVRNPGGIADLLARIVDKSLSPVDLVQGYLDRISATDHAVEAWREVDGERALSEARVREQEAAAGKIRGLLHGIPVGVKDIIDVEGVASQCGSKLRADAAVANADAEVVSALKSQGAIVLGKLHTTEFAFRDASPARNPWNLAHTPGGSSSGSGAAVAAGMVPVALGTQTLASVNRPAAYCGIAAFKPSSRSMSSYGIAPLAPSYDTVGFYGARVDDAVHAFEAAAPRFMRLKYGHRGSNALRVVLVDDPLIESAEPDMKAAYSRMADAIAAAGHKVETRKSLVSCEEIGELQRSTMTFESGRAHRDLLKAPQGQVGLRLLELIEEGLSISSTTYLDQRGKLDRLRREVFQPNRDAHAFLWPATPAPAPEGLAWTGDASYIGPWTGLGGPMLSVPAGLASNGMPLGCLLMGRPGTDAEMCDWGRRLAEAGEVSPFDLA